MANKIYWPSGLEGREHVQVMTSYLRSDVEHTAAAVLSIQHQTGTKLGWWWVGIRTKARSLHSATNTLNLFIIKFS